MNAERLLQHFERISEAPDAIPRLRRFILDLAVRGKLVEQDPNDEPASELLKRIQVEKERLVKKPKALPKVTDDEEPFALPQGWEWVQIRQVTTDCGQAVPQSDFTYIDVTAINKERGCIAEPKIFSASQAPSRARKLVQKGDVIYSCVRPYLLNIAVVDSEIEPPLIASTAFAVMYGFGLILPQYLWVTLRSPFMVECVETCMRGQAYPAINDSDFAVLPIPLPPLAEQHRIVAKVNELMALCDPLEAAKMEREQNRDRLVAASLHRLNSPADAAEADTTGLQAQQEDTFRDHAGFVFTHLSRLTTRPEHIKQLRQSILNLAVRGKLVPQELNDEPPTELLKRMVQIKQLNGMQNRTGKLHQVTDESDETPFLIPASWLWLRIDDLFEVLGGIQKTPARAPQRNAFPYLGVGNVYRGRIDLTTVKEFELQDGELERWQLKIGDLLIIEGNGSLTEIGRCAIWNGAIDKCVHQNHVIRCRPFDLKISKFVLQFLNSPVGTAIMQRLAITSSGLYSLSVGKIRQIEIPFSPSPSNIALSRR